jgi:hypothetical protein
MDERKDLMGIFRSRQILNPRGLGLTIRHTAPLMGTPVVLWLLTTGCASLTNTPAQDVAWSRWTLCHAHVTGTEIRAVHLDGRVVFWYNGSADRLAMLECLQLATRDGPVLPEPIFEPLECGGSSGM